MIYATLNGEVRQVVREHRGVIWCPFCDRSSQILKEAMWCDGCHGQFSDKLFDWLNQVSIFNSKPNLEELRVTEPKPRPKSKPPAKVVVDAVL